MTIKELLFGKEKPESESVLSADEVAELREKVEQAEVALQQSAESAEALKKQLSDAQARIAELEKSAAATHTKTNPPQEGAPSQNAWDNDPINQRARAFSRRRPAPVA